MCYKRFYGRARAKRSVPQMQRVSVEKNGGAMNKVNHDGVGAVPVGLRASKPAGNVAGAGASRDLTLNA